LTPYRYPVVLSFQDWKFPRTIPDEWTRPYYDDPAVYTSQQSTITGAVRARDITCRMSEHFTSTQVAHLCPEHEKEWFLRNSMSVWNTDLTLDPDNLTNDLSNVVLLRSDLHTAFDNRKFVFYPKSSEGFVTHMLEPSPDLTQLYHNRLLHPLLQCNPRFLYARFAWAIFPSLSGFFSKPGIPKIVFMLKATGDRVEWTEQEVTRPEELRPKIASSRSRSPKKRQRATEEPSDEADEVMHETHRDCKKACTRRVSRTPTTISVPWSEQEEFLQHDSNGVPKEVSEDERARLELHEDMQLLQERVQLVPGQEPPAWYPGWRQAERRKRKWLEYERNRYDCHLGQRREILPDLLDIGSEVSISLLETRGVCVYDDDHAALDITPCLVDDNID